MNSNTTTNKVLYVYQCKECGHHGNIHLTDDTHDGKNDICKNCGTIIKLEWDGGTTLTLPK